MQTAIRVALSFVLFFFGLFGGYPAALADAPAPGQSDYVEFDQALAQAKSFAKKGWHREAVKELRRALTTSQGEKSFDAHLLLAQECFQEADIGCSLNMAATARSLARTPEERIAAQNMLDFLNKNFGKVEFRAGVGELTEGYLELSTEDPILDQHVKRYYKEKALSLATQRRSLPWIMYLPAATYSLYGKEFTVEGGTESVVDAGFTPENSKPKAVPSASLIDFLHAHRTIALGIQLPIGGKGAASQPDLLLTAAPLRFGVNRLAGELHLLGGINTASTGEVVPVLALGLGVGGYQRVWGNIDLRWSVSLISGVGAFSLRCGPLSGDPATVQLTCGLDDGFAATIRAPWFGPKVELGLPIVSLGKKTKLGLTISLIGERYNLAGGRERYLTVRGSDGKEYEVPYQLTGGDFGAFLPALLPSATIWW